jgi:hypothetical protein
LPAGFAGLAFFRGAGRSGAFLAVFFRIVVAFLTAFLRVLLPAGIFLRRTLALPFAFLLVAIAASLTLTDFGSGSPHYPPKARKDKEKKTARRITRGIKREESPAISATLGGTFVQRVTNLSPGRAQRTFEPRVARSVSNRKMVRERCQKNTARVTDSG